jgi:hypothetical protein
MNFREEFKGGKYLMQKNEISSKQALFFGVT